MNSIIKVSSLIVSIILTTMVSPAIEKKNIFFQSQYFSKFLTCLM